MRILITGGAGFLGSHVVEFLVSEGHDVTVLDNLTTGLRNNVHPKARLVVGDVRESLSTVFTSVLPDVVVHLAAQVSVPSSLKQPGDDLAVNLAGSVNVIEESARTGVQKLVVVSSAAVYGAPQSIPLTEDNATTPLSPYGLSKLSSEHYVRLLCDSHRIRYTILRPANIYGTRQLAEGDGAVIPSFLKRFLNGTDPIIHGAGNQTRDFLYVSDMAHAISQALTRADGLTLNVSSGTGVSILSLWTILAKLTDWKREPVFGPSRPGDILHSVMANDAARVHLNWEPQVRLTYGLEQTVTWAVEHMVHTQSASQV